ncbi:dioxygenases related to 2-nitropropane dioxygenase [Clostridium sp. CAG:632]|nr:nitronate monooxygenase [Lachnospiraceae bacterium]MBS6466446.1 nitronate monooxygenase [Clostridium sp.]MDD6267551.1 nitronate monooxygenase [Clostridium sp.]CCY59008.1 dioxygenases related to 2-nitropropane dioxygenase [Clostridium sp. CAG:632]
MLLNEMLGIKYPIIQGGMANIATGKFAAQVSNAGALGLIASGGMNAEALEKEIAECRKLTDKPFGVNLMLMNPDVDNIAQLLADEKIGIITTGAGMPGKYMGMWKANGSKVIPVVASTALARKVEQQGADAVIAEGGESGGHVGDMTTMTLVPQVIEKVSIPVIAAGGIATGKQFVAAMALGAVGVQIGTCLLVSEECPIHENYKLALIKARDNSTTVTGRSLDAPVRILKNDMAREYIKVERSGGTREELEQFTLGGLRRAVLDGDVKNGSVMAGQVCGQLKEIQPLSVILENLYEDAKKELKELQSLQL